MATGTMTRPGSTRQAASDMSSGAQAALAKFAEYLDGKRNRKNNFFAETKNFYRKLCKHISANADDLRSDLKLLIFFDIDNHLSTVEADVLQLVRDDPAAADYYVSKAINFIDNAVDCFIRMKQGYLFTNKDQIVSRFAASVGFLWWGPFGRVMDETRSQMFGSPDEGWAKIVAQARRHKAKKRAETFMRESGEQFMKALERSTSMLRHLGIGGLDGGGPPPLGENDLINALQQLSARGEAGNILADPSSIESRAVLREIAAEFQRRGSNIAFRESLADNQSFYSEYSAEDTRAYADHPDEVRIVEWPGYRRGRDHTYMGLTTKTKVDGFISYMRTNGTYPALDAHGMLRRNKDNRPVLIQCTKAEWEMIKQYPPYRGRKDDLHSLWIPFMQPEKAEDLGERPDGLSEQDHELLALGRKQRKYVEAKTRLGRLQYDVKVDEDGKPLKSPWLDVPRWGRILGVVGLGTAPLLYAGTFAVNAVKWVTQLGWVQAIGNYFASITPATAVLYPGALVTGIAGGLLAAGILAYVVPKIWRGIRGLLSRRRRTRSEAHSRGGDSYGRYREAGHTKEDAARLAYGATDENPDPTADPGIWDLDRITRLRHDVYAPEAGNGGPNSPGQRPGGGGSPGNDPGGGGRDDEPDFGPRTPEPAGTQPQPPVVDDDGESPIPPHRDDEPPEGTGGSGPQPHVDSLVGLGAPNVTEQLRPQLVQHEHSRVVADRVERVYTDVARRATQAGMSEQDALTVHLNELFALPAGSSLNPMSATSQLSNTAGALGRPVTWAEPGEARDTAHNHETRLRQHTPRMPQPHR